MGHSVCLGGRPRHATTRTCDVCDTCPRESGRKMRWDRCPAGYCGDSKLCSSCAPLDHSTCATAVARQEARAATQAALLDAGEYVRCSAVGIDGTGEVRVWFRNRAGAELVAEVAQDAYAFHPLCEPKTPADYGIEPDNLIPAERFAGMAPWTPQARMVDGVDVTPYIDAMREWLAEWEFANPATRSADNAIATVAAHYQGGVAEFVRDEGDARYLRSTERATCGYCGRSIPIVAALRSPIPGDTTVHCSLECEASAHSEADEAPAPPTEARDATVKRIDLFGAVIDTYRTEAELNGFRASQGRML